MATTINEFIKSSLNWGVCPFNFYTDCAKNTLSTPNTPGTPGTNTPPDELKKTKLYELSQSRLKLKAFCAEAGILAPAFTFADKFDKLAAWAVKHNRFPMVIKPDANLSNGEYCFVLKAFRELSEFYDKIECANKGSVILEEFAPSKHYIEVTVINGRMALASQITFEQSMQLRHASRLYPLKIPQAIKKELASVLNKFSELKTLKNVPCRFSFAAQGQRLVLLSLNIGTNRPEYHPDFSSAAGIDNIFQKRSGQKNQALCKIMNFFEIGTDDYKISELEAVLKNTPSKYICTGSQTIVMISCQNQIELTDKTKEVKAFFRRHAKSAFVLPPEPNEE